MAKRSMPEKILETPEVNTEEAVILGVDLAEPKPVLGIVSGCTKLNVRKKPSKLGYSGVAAVIDEDDELEIYLDESTEDWYKVLTEDGVSGYCMKKFVTLK